MLEKKVFGFLQSVFESTLKNTLSRSGFCAELQLKQVLCIMCVPTLTIVTSAYSWPDSRHSSPGLSSTISDSRSAFCAELQLKQVLCILCVPMLSIVTSAALTIVTSAYSWPDSRHSGPESQFSMHFYVVIIAFQKMHSPQAGTTIVLAARGGRRIGSIPAMNSSTCTHGG